MSKPTTFTEIVAVIDTMPVILLNARRARALSQREAAAQIGVSFSTVSRMETGGEFSSVSLRAVLTWLEAS